MVYKAAIVYMNDVQFTTLKHEHYFFGVSYKFYELMRLEYICKKTRCFSFAQRVDESADTSKVQLTDKTQCLPSEFPFLEMTEPSSQVYVQFCLVYFRDQFLIQ